MYYVATEVQYRRERVRVFERQLVTSVRAVVRELDVAEENTNTKTKKMQENKKFMGRGEGADTINHDRVVEVASPSSANEVRCCDGRTV